MRTLLRKCPECSEYTMREVCGRCCSRTETPIPPRFSPEDRYGEYRRRLKKEQMKSKK